MKKGLLVLAMIFLAFNSYGQLGLPYYDSAVAKNERKDYEGAIYEISKAIELENSKSIYIGGWYEFRGALKNVLKDYRGALTDFDKAISLIPIYNTKSIADSYNGRSLSKISLGKYDDAIKDTDKAIKLVPNEGRYYVMRGLAKININSIKDSGCLDFSKAGELGYKEAYDLIKEFCN
jgi:tetratricopeptide (TPR) repeat protein